MDDAELIAASARGDADAFATLYRRHLAKVVGYALRATGDAEVAADLTGEVFAAALAGCGRYRPEHESAAPWLLGIAQNKLRESRRRGRVENETRRRLRMAALPLEDGDLERVEELAALGTLDLAAVIELLPATEREAVRARVIDERDYREIADELECSESVVRQRVSRGLARARTRLSTQTQSEGEGRR
jgi:RNA polymerase sigma-70 factor, ECF subfamily